MYPLSFDNFLIRFYISSGLIPGKAKSTSGFKTSTTYLRKQVVSLRFNVVTFNPNPPLLSLLRIAVFSCKNFVKAPFLTSASDLQQCYLILC
jgi:hypothetical protein